MQCCPVSAPRNYNARATQECSEIEPFANHVRTPQRERAARAEIACANGFKFAIFARLRRGAPDRRGQKHYVVLRSITVTEQQLATFAPENAVLAAILVTLELGHKKSLNS